MKKTSPIELENFNRFLEDMAEVLDIPRRRLDRIVFQGQPPTIKEKIQQGSVKKSRASSKAALAR